MAEIDNLIAEVNKKYKTDIIRKASDLKGIEFIPYTSPMMNYLTRGGVPVGRIIELVGLPQSGKTTTALDIISNFQKKYTDKYCVYLDAENTIDKEWGETLGVDWSKVILIQPESEYGEELLDMLLDYIRSGKIGLAVISKIELVDAEEEKQEVQEVVVDFREAKEVAKEVAKELTEKDSNWKWRVQVLKSEIRVWWGYLQYCDTEDSHFTIKMSDREDECGTDTDFMVARNEHDEYMTGRIVGVDECWQDGDLNTCVTGLLRGIATIAHSRY